MNDEKTNKIMSSEELDDVLPKYEPIKLSGKNLAQNYVSAFNTGMNIYQCINYLQGNIDWTIKAVNDVVKSWNTEVSESIDQSKAIALETTIEQFNVEWTNKQPELIEQVNTLTTNKFNEDWGVLENRINTTLENQNTNINVQNTKINSIQTQQTNLANEQTTLYNRMDTFTRLSEGSTTGDAELQDIRVGANDITYDTAGNAVRGQYSQLKEDLEATNNAFEKSTTVINDTSKFINNEYFDINGARTENEFWRTTDFISCYGFNLISFTLPYHVTADKKVATIAFYDIEKHFITGAYNTVISDGEGVYDGYWVIPENARFIKCTTNTTETYTPNVTLLNDSVNVNLDGKFTNSQVYAPTGDPAYFAGWYESDFIPINGFSSVTYLASGYHSNNIQLETLTFFNANADRISGIFNNISDNNARNSEGIAPIPKDAKFMKVCYNSASGAYPKITLNTTKLKGKVWCIGDSLIEGYIGSEISKINYPSIMQKKLGNEYTVMNKGVGGSQAITWWSKWKNLLFFQDKPTTILIMLGANGGLEGTFETDVDPYSNYNDYTNTVTGCTCKLIEWLQEQAPKAEIIFLTTTYVDGELAPNNKREADNQNKYIYELQNRYNIPVIDVRKLMGVNMKNSSELLSSDGLHGTLKFYERLGSLVASQYLSVKWTQES